ncbi:putative signal transduction histidine kinase [Treponema brennaborense DSM 12168]|uniref:histidine kinase n=2 Tax=Treponema TaxID=157 RepID=F4LQ19_TREBD|nr:putative signal transduction histidine kinase [Treponema brennaborense DSM 12168]
MARRIADSPLRHRCTAAAFCPPYSVAPVKIPCYYGYMIRKRFLITAAVVALSLVMLTPAVLYTKTIIPRIDNLIFSTTYQVYILLLIDLGVTLLFLFQNSICTAITLTVKTAILIFTCQAIGSTAEIYQYVYVSLLLETVFLVSIPVSTIVSAGITAIMLFSLLPHTTFFTHIGGLSQAQTLHAILYGVVLIAAGTLVSWYRNRCRQLQQEMYRLEDVINRISNTNLAYQNYAAISESKAIEKERNRISREIHDIIGYTMTNILMLIQAALHTEDEAKRTELLETAITHLNSGVDDARLALRRLRERDIESAHGPNLFLQLTRTFAALTGIAIAVDFGNTPKVFNSKVEKTIFRMIQESMTNSFKHGKATKIAISFSYENDWITVRIHDNGQGGYFSGERVKEGIGIRGMRERISAAGGFFSAVFAIDGFIVQAVIPMEQEDE